MDLQLLGKRALVTGATGGIGEATARMLAAEGVVVAVNGRKHEKIDRVVAEIRSAGGEAVSALGDVETDAGIEMAVAAVKTAIGGVDILVNNVGGRVHEGTRDWHDVPIDDWVASYRKNAGAAVVLINQFVGGMKKEGWGRIINISTMAAIEPNETLPEYQAAKAGLNNLTKSLSKALKQTGVTANTVSPGVVMTDGVRWWIREVAKGRGWPGSFEDHERRYVTEVRPIAASSAARPEELAYVITMLASPLSRYLTGSNIRVDGGAIGVV